MISAEIQCQERRNHTGASLNRTSTYKRPLLTLRCKVYPLRLKVFTLILIQSELSAHIICTKLTAGLFFKNVFAVCVYSPQTARVAAAQTLAAVSQQHMLVLCLYDQTPLLSSSRHLCAFINVRGSFLSWRWNIVRTHHHLLSPLQSKLASVCARSLLCIDLICNHTDSKNVPGTHTL